MLASRVAKSAAVSRCPLEVSTYRCVFWTFRTMPYARRSRIGRPILALIRRRTSGASLADLGCRSKRRSLFLKPAVGEFATVDGPEDRQIVEIADAQCPGAAPVFDDGACHGVKDLGAGGGLLDGGECTRPNWRGKKKAGFRWQFGKERRETAIRLRERTMGQNPSRNPSGLLSKLVSRAVGDPTNN